MGGRSWTIAHPVMAPGSATGSAVLAVTSATARASLRTMIRAQIAAGQCLLRPVLGGPVRSLRVERAADTKILEKPAHKMVGHAFKRPDLLLHQVSQNALWMRIPQFAHRILDLLEIQGRNRRPLTTSWPLFQSHSSSPRVPTMRRNSPSPTATPRWDLPMAVSIEALITNSLLRRLLTGM